jgi:hypothetical protein
VVFVFETLRQIGAETHLTHRVQVIYQVFENGRHNMDNLAGDFLPVNVVADHREEILRLDFAVEHRGIKHIQDPLDGDGFGDGIIEMIVLDAFHNRHLGFVLPRHQMLVATNRGKHVIQHVVFAILLILVAVIVEKRLGRGHVEIPGIREEIIDEEILFHRKLL